MPFPAPRRNPKWKRQLAIFGAAVSAFVGLGIVLILFFTSRDAGHKSPAPKPAPEARQATP